MLAVLVSRDDSTSVHIGEHLRDLADWTVHTDSTRPDDEGGDEVLRIGADTGDGADAERAPAVELREIDTLHLETTNVADVFGTVADGPDWDPTLLVFASRHAGETGALLTAHHTGNLGPAEFGGEDGALARACPNAHRQVLDALREHAPEDFEVGMECTHHGPSAVGVPSMFVELGSGPEQWEDGDAARAVARAILELRGVPADAPVEADGETAAATETGDERRHLVGFGGGHYAPRFERIARETDWAVGHVAADWALDDLGDPADHPEVIERVFAESAATRAVVDGDPGVADAIEELGYRVVSETWVRETGETADHERVSLALADALETALCPVEEGLRFGDRARGEDAPALSAEAVAVVDLPADPLAEAQGIDRERARAVVEAATLAFETTDSGTRAAGRAALADPADRENLIEGLAAVLRAEYDTVERVDGAIRATERAFDPERARTLGIPEGPKFGRLAEGQAVEVDGETVDPEVVHVERERRFPVKTGVRDGDRE